MLVDTHCHINSLSPDARDILFSQDRGKDYIFIDTSIDLMSSLDSLSLSRNYEYIYSALGFHPFSSQNYNSDLIEWYQNILEENPKVLAVGEIGLDYKASVSLERQEAVLRDFITLAYRNGLPIAIHNRFDQKLVFTPGRPYILNVLDDIVKNYDKILFHCFSYGPAFLNEIINKGGFVSFSLNVLRARGEILDSLRRCPLDRILLETDSPYMKIEGKPSTPLDIDKVYDKVAEIKNIKRDVLEHQVRCNVSSIFDI